MCIRDRSGKLNIDGHVLQITHVGRKTRVRSAFMNRTVQNKPSVFGLEPLNKRKAEHLIAHLGCKYESDWDATFHAVEHFTVVILVSRTNGAWRLNRILNDPRAIVQIERRHIGVEALFRVVDRKRKDLIGILLHPILARPEDP